MKQKVVNLALGFVAITIAAPVNASNWVYLTTSNTNAEYHIDLASIRDQKISYKNVRLAWFKIDYSKDVSVPQYETRVLLHFNCERSELKWVQMVDYDHDGSVLDSDTASTYGKFSVAVPDTIGHTLMNAACNWQT